jgi:hypothetical protein
VVGASTTVGVTGGAGTFTLPDLAKLDETVPNRFRARSVIFGNNSIINLARQFAAPSVEDVFEPIATDGYALWGNPYFEASAMVAVKTAGSKILVMGDPSFYVIVDRIGMEVEIISNLFGASFRPTGQRGVLASGGTPPRSSTPTLSAPCSPKLILLWRSHVYRRSTAATAIFGGSSRRQPHPTVRVLPGRGFSRVPRRCHVGRSGWMAR